VNVIDNLFFANLTDDRIKAIDMVHDFILCQDGTFNSCNISFDEADNNLFIDYFCTS